MSEYREMKEFFLGKAKEAQSAYEAANSEAEKLEALQGVANVLTLLQQIETLINAEIINNPVVLPVE